MGELIRITEEMTGWKPFSGHSSYDVRVEKSLMEDIISKVNTKYLPGVDTEHFVELFMKSKYKSYRDFLVGRVYELEPEEFIENFVEYDLNGDAGKIKKFGLEGSEDEYYHPWEKIWIADMYVHLGVELKITSEDIFNIFGWKFMRMAFVNGHQYGFQDYLELLIDSYKDEINEKKNLFEVLSVRRGWDE